MTTRMQLIHIIIIYFFYSFWFLTELKQTVFIIIIITFLKG